MIIVKLKEKHNSKKIYLILLLLLYHFSFILLKVRELNEYDIIKRKLIKRACEIQRNSELICFINHKYIKKYKIFLENNMENENEKNIFNYLNNNWIKKSPKLYNYYNIILDDNNEYNNKILTHFYSINNVAASIHPKISKYLPKNKISNNDFVYCIKNILKINEVKLNKIISKDYIIGCLRKISIDIKDENFKWIKFEELKKIEREIIALDKDIVEELTLEKICSAINEIDLDKEKQINEINTMNNFEDKKGK